MIERKPLALIEKTDIDALVAGQVSESRSLDYKEQLPGNADGDKKEFLADATSFANATGGDIVFGVRERRDASGKPTGLPQDAPGLVGLNADAEIRRLEAILVAGAGPRVPGVQFNAIDGFANGPVLLLRVPRSWAGPHMVVYQQWSRFYTRNNAGKYALDVQEIRAAFALSEALPERIRRFRDDRLARIVAGETPVPLRQEKWIAMHLVPLASMEPGTQIDLAGIAAQTSSLQPMSATGWNNRYNIDGFCTWSGDDGGRSGRSYVQVFRNGIIEAVDTSPVDFHEKHGPFIRIESLEQQLIDAAARLVAVQERAGIAVPILLLVTLVGVRDARLGVSQMYNHPDVAHIDRDMLTLPDLLIEDYRVAAAAALRPVFDSIWQAAGWSRSLCYDDKGNRVGLRR